MKKSFRWVVDDPDCRAITDFLCFSVDAMSLFFICFGCISLFVGDVNWIKKGIEQIDHFVV
ncbi:MAG: hypothetical protein WCJ06_07120 [Planctomycetota bacterium]